MVDKFEIDVEQLKQEQVSVLKSMKMEAEKHLNYFNSTMHAFSNSENRVKCFDTVYYEEVLPIIDKILNEHEFRKRIITRNK
jgi:hypothetical protein